MIIDQYEVVHDHLHERVCIHDLESLSKVNHSSHVRVGTDFLTAESTSYTRKPELRLVRGVIEGPICMYRCENKQFRQIKLRTQETAPAVSADIVVALLL
jgi:hypothetical protein